MAGRRAPTTAIDASPSRHPRRARSRTRRPIACRARSRSVRSSRNGPGARRPTHAGEGNGPRRPRQRSRWRRRPPKAPPPRVTSSTTRREPASRPRPPRGRGSPSVAIHRATGRRLRRGRPEPRPRHGREPAHRRQMSRASSSRHVPSRARAWRAARPTAWREDRPHRRADRRALVPALLRSQLVRGRSSAPARHPAQEPAGPGALRRAGGRRRRRARRRRLRTTTWRASSSPVARPPVRRKPRRTNPRLRPGLRPTAIRRRR